MTGAACAFEGITGGTALINAPTGCKFLSGWLADLQDPRGTQFSPMAFSGPGRYGQARVPTTALTEQDYVRGSAGKVRELVSSLTAEGATLIGIVNGPGTALIGDDLRSVARAAPIPVAVVEAAGLLGPAGAGFGAGVCALLEALNPPAMTVKPRTVNLLGISIQQVAWQACVEEIRHLLATAGVEVNAVFTAGESIERLRTAGAAALHVSVFEESGEAVAESLTRRFGTPRLDPRLLAPIGLQATEAWLSAICEDLGVSGEPLRAASEATRRRCAQAIARADANLGLPRGCTFAIVAEASVVAPLTLFLVDYLGMVPVLLAITERGMQAEAFLNWFLPERHLSPVRLIVPDPPELADALRPARPDVLYGSTGDGLIARSVWGPEAPPCVTVGWPAWGEVRLTHRPLIGFAGVLTLVEETLTALMRHETGAIW